MHNLRGIFNKMKIHEGDLIWHHNRCETFIVIELAAFDLWRWNPNSEIVCRCSNFACVDIRVLNIKTGELHNFETCSDSYHEHTQESTILLIRKLTP